MIKGKVKEAVVFAIKTVILQGQLKSTLLSDILIGIQKTTFSFWQQLCQLYAMWPSKVVIIISKRLLSCIIKI